MAEKLLKRKPRKVAPSRARSSSAPRTPPGKVVLVGTYKDRQLDCWPGYYNYPLGEDEFLAAKNAKSAKKDGAHSANLSTSQPLNLSTFQRVNELWLFQGAKAGRFYSAEFVGIFTRKELKEKFGYPATGKAHGERYALYKTSATEIYNPASGLAEAVVVRAADFAKRSPKIAKQIKAYLESPDRKDPVSAKLVPKILTQVPRETLRVCEAAVQMTFLPNLIRPIKCDFPLANGERPIAIDLFAGCGGLSLGFEQAGFDIVAAVEIDPIHAAVHEYNFPRCKTICADIKNISGEDIRRLAHIENQEVDIVFGGAPCQGFSMIGKRALDDPRNQLIGHYLRIVSDIRPKYCVLENVKGLTVGKHAQFLSELIDELKKIRYKVLLPYRVLNAADYGVPQNRERLFLIAAREDQVLPEYPLPQKERVTIGDAISDVPDADSYDDLLSDDSVPVKWETKQEYARQLRGLSRDESNYGYERQFDKDRLTASWRTIHGVVSKERFLAAPQGETEPHSRFFKLAWDGQSNTLRAGTDSARGGFTSPRPIHPTLPRVITVREAARIHSYPDWFRFNKTKWHGFREIGNSVPPRLARAVGSMILKALGLKPSKPKIILEAGDESLLEFDMRSAADYFSVPRTVIAQRKRKSDGEKHRKN